MSDLIDGVRLVRNDGSEEFVFKAESVQKQQSNDLVTDSVISGLREIIGGKLVFEREVLRVEGIISGTSNEQYPNSGSYDDNDLGFERELDRASKQWGWTSSDGFDLLYWGDRSPIQGVLTQVNATENATDPNLGPGSYSFTVEFTYLDAFIA